MGISLLNFPDQLNGESRIYKRGSPFVVGSYAQTLFEDSLSLEPPDDNPFESFPSVAVNAPPNTPLRIRISIPHPLFPDATPLMSGEIRLAPLVGVETKRDASISAPASAGGIAAAKSNEATDDRTTESEDDQPADVHGSGAALTIPPMEFDTLDDFLKPGKDMFDKEMLEIDERLATAVEGSTEHRLFATKKKQLQERWDLSVAQVKGMAVAAKAGKPVQLAPIVIPNNARPWQAPMPDPLPGHDEDIAKVLVGTWDVKRWVEDGEEPPFPIEGSTVTFSKNTIVMHLKEGDKQAEMQQLYRIGSDKIDIWNTDSGPNIQTALPHLGSYSIENDTLRICYHDSPMELETPQSRPPVQPGKRLIYWELQRKVDEKVSADRGPNTHSAHPIDTLEILPGSRVSDERTFSEPGTGLAEKVKVAKGKTDDRRSGQSYQISLLVLGTDDLKPVSGATVEVTFIGDDNGVTGDGGFADFKTDEDGIAIVDKSLWPGRYQINVRAPKDSRYRDTEFSKDESLLVIHADGRYSPREFRLVVDDRKSTK